tara:strand:- start:397 stop:1101 length:705 start_codon:yes stop_codon:yes gene_type:complete
MILITHELFSNLTVYMKKCPPGLICINNFLLGIIVTLIIFCFFVFGKFTQNIILTNNDKTIVENKDNQNQGYNGFNFGFPFSFPSFPYNNLPNDVLLNPYAPPLKDDRYFTQPLTFPSRGMVPINVSTNPGVVDTSYRQVGFMSPVNPTNDKDKMIPLMGRPLYTNRDKWQYYTMSDQRNSIKLPIIKNGRSCTNEYGCDSLSTGESVHIEGLQNDTYKVRLYDTDTIRYLPFI